MSDDTRERIAEDLAVILRQKGLHGWLKKEPLPLARSIVEAMLQTTRCDFQDDGVRGDVGGPCRKLRGHDGDHDPFERVTPDSLRETFGLPPVDEMRRRNETSAHLYGADWEDVRAGAALASALMAANYAGDSGEDVDRLIAEILARGYRLARLLPDERADLPYTPDYGPAHRLEAPMRPAPPDLLIDSAIADVRAIRGYANSRAERDIDMERDISHETDRPTVYGDPNCEHKWSGPLDKSPTCVKCDMAYRTPPASLGSALEEALTATGDHHTLPDG